MSFLTEDCKLGLHHPAVNKIQVLKNKISEFVTNHKTNNDCERAMNKCVKQALEIASHIQFHSLALMFELPFESIEKIQQALVLKMMGYAGKTLSSSQYQDFRSSIEGKSESGSISKTIFNKSL